MIIIDFILTSHTQNSSTIQSKKLSKKKKNVVSVWRTEGEKENKYTKSRHTNEAHYSDTPKKNLSILQKKIFLDAATVSILLVSLFRSSETFISTPYERFFVFELHENAHWLKRSEKKNRTEEWNNNNKYIRNSDSYTHTRTHKLM